MARRIGLIGFGGIGESILEAWHTRPLAGYEFAALLVRTHQLKMASASVLPGVMVTDRLETFLKAGLDIVVEAAGQGAVRESAISILQSGVDFFVISTGALADAGFRQSLSAQAEIGPGRLIIPVGATAGLDGLLAMRQDGLTSVTYTSVKPPKAWKGTPAETNFDLDQMVKRTTIFSGPADAAALAYPKNANLAATVAMAGLGFAATRVELVADPVARGNTGRIDAESAHSNLTVIVSGRASARNPKTSAITGMSVLSALANRTATLSFG